MIRSAQTAAPKKRPTLLRDDPECEDAFGPHGRLADAIFALVTKSDGLTLGLIGTRGSGKSSIVRQIEKHNGSANETEVGVFVFDAWAHRGDPLRRAFLEELIAFLASREPAAWITVERGKKTTDELAQRTKTTNRKTSSHLTLWGHLTAYSALVVPIGLGILTTEPGKYNYVWSSAVAMTALPVIVATIGIASQLTRATKCKEPLWKIFANESTTAENIKEVTSPDPTSVEFQQYFRELMGEALSVEKRRLLIVPDNLDRLDVDDRRNLWAVLRTYVDILDSGKDNWSPKVWTLVPWLGVEKPSKTTGGKQPPPAIDNKENTDKLFNAELRVPPPLLSKWEAYLRSQLVLAGLAREPDDDDYINLATALMAALERARKDLPITPRRLKQFVNRVVIFEISADPNCSRTAKLWLAAILDDSPAWHPLDPLPIWHAATGTPAPSLPDLAGLALGTSPALAMQVLFRSQITAALAKGESLDDLFAQCPEVGPTVEQEIRSQLGDWGSSSTMAVGRAALSLSTAPPNNPACRSARQLLAAKAFALSELIEADSLSASGLTTLFDVKPELAPHTLALLKSPSDADGIAALSAIAEHLAQSRPILLERFHIELGASGYIGALSSEAIRPSGLALPYLRPAPGTESAIVVKLAETAQSADEAWLRAITNCVRVNCTWDWEPLRTEIGARLNSQNAPASNLIAALYAVTPSDPGRIRQTLQPSRNSGWLWANGASVGSAAPEPLANWVAAVLIAEPNPATPNNSTAPNWNLGLASYKAAMEKDNAPPGLDAIAAVVLRLGAADQVMRERSRFNSIKRLLAAIARQDPKFPPAAELFENWTEWQEILTEPERRNHALATRSALVDAAVAKPLDLAAASKYLDLFNLFQGEKRLAAYLDQALRALRKETWLDIITNGGPLLALALSSVSLDPKFQPACALQDALAAAATKAAITPIKASAQDIGKLCALLSGAALTILKRDIAKSLCDLTNSAETLLAAFLPALNDRPPLPEDVTRDLVYGFLRQASERNHEAEIALVADLVQAHKTEFSAAPADCRADAAQRFANARESASAASQAAIDRILQALSQPTAPEPAAPLSTPAA